MIESANTMSLRSTTHCLQAVRFSSVNLNITQTNIAKEYQLIGLCCSVASCIFASIVWPLQRLSICRILCTFNFQQPTPFRFFRSLTTKTISNKGFHLELSLHLVRAGVMGLYFVGIKGNLKTDINIQ